MAHARHNRFRLYFFDTGLLGRALGLSYADHRFQDLPYKGFIAENFVQNELGVWVSYPTYGWQQAQAEIEFLHRCKDGEIIPVEVKSDARTRARSLQSFVNRYSPSRAVKLVGTRAPAAARTAGCSRLGHCTTPSSFASSDLAMLAEKRAALETPCQPTRSAERSRMVRLGSATMPPIAATVLVRDCCKPD